MEDEPEVDGTAESVADTLEQIDGAFERALLGFQQAMAGQTVPLAEL